MNIIIIGYTLFQGLLDILNNWLFLFVVAIIIIISFLCFYIFSYTWTGSCVVQFLQYYYLQLHFPSTEDLELSEAFCNELLYISTLIYNSFLANMFNVCIFLY